MVATNPSIFRASNTNNWASRYIEKKSTEFALHSTKDQEIQKFVIKFFKSKSLNVHTCRLNYSNNALSIFISYQKNCTVSSLIKKINTSQKMKLERKGRYLGRKNTLKNSKNHKQVLQGIKRYYEYKSFKNQQKSTKTKKSLLVILGGRRIRRIKTVSHYKKHLNLQKNITEHNARVNNSLNGLFQSLSIFLQKPLNITLVLLPLNNNIKRVITKKQFVSLKKKFIKFKRHTQSPFFKDGVNLLPALINQKNSAELLAKYVATSLKKQKRHNFFLRFIKSALRVLTYESISSPIKGIQIEIKGRVNGAPRARCKRIRIGKEIPNSTINYKIYYNESTSYTLNGTMSVKVWVYEKKTCCAEQT